MIELHDYILSSDAYKVRLLLRMLGLDYKAVKVDIHPGREHRSEGFLALNPLGTLPVLTEGQTRLYDAQAILVYLALAHDPARTWLPVDPLLAARVTLWLTFAGRELEGLSRLRMADIQGAPLPGREDIRADTLRALAILEDLLSEQALQGSRWLVGDGPTIADVAMFPPVALAADAGVALEPYPELWRWLGDFKRLPGFIVMPGVLPPDLADALL